MSTDIDKITNSNAIRHRERGGGESTSTSKLVFTNDDDDDDDDNNTKNDHAIKIKATKKCITNKFQSLMLSLPRRLVLNASIIPTIKRHRVLLSILLIIFTCQSLLTLLDVIFRTDGITHTPLDDFDESSSSSIAAASPQPPQQKHPSKSFAVIINTYKRPDILPGCIHHYAEKCGKRHGVGQVFIVWSEDGDPPSLSSLFSLRGDRQKRRRYSKNNNDNDNDNRSSVTFLRVKNSLNSRFLPISSLNSDAVFSVDDDIRVDCRSLQRGFMAWRENPNAHVGYYPRSHSSSSSSSDERGSRMTYHLWPYVYVHGTFSMVLTKASFMHRNYLSRYSSEENPREIRDYVHERRNCEDIAMSLLIANHTMTTGSRLATVYVEGSVGDGGLFNGISTGSGHHESRSDCLTKFRRIYEGMGWRFPLRSVRLRDGSYTRHFPGIFWWQVKPSNFFEWFSFF